MYVIVIIICCNKHLFHELITSLLELFFFISALTCRGKHNCHIYVISMGLFLLYLTIILNVRPQLKREIHIIIIIIPTILPYLNIYHIFILFIPFLCWKIFEII